MKYLIITILVATAGVSYAQDCPNTHFSCGGTICCPR